MSKFFETAKSTIKDNFKALSFASIIVLLPIILLTITKLNPKNADIRNLNYICDEVYKINLTLSKGVTEQTVDTEFAKNTLPLIKSNLEIAKKNLISIEASNSGADLKEKVSQALSRNIMLVDQALSMYMSPDSSTLREKNTTYKETFNLFAESLQTLKVYGIDEIISKNSLQFLINTHNYFDTLLNLNILNDISSSSERDFLLKLSTITANFDLIKEDLQPAITNIKENNRSLTGLLSDIEEKKNIFSKIEEEYYMLSIPETAKVISENLESCISTYDIYINSLFEAVNSDLTNSNEDYSKKLYDSAYSKRNDFLQFYSDLSANIYKLKNK